MAKKKTSLVIEESLWQDVKIHCIKQKKEISEYLEDLIKRDLHKK
ncbi:MAG: hypothetical protein Q7S33_05655 [Nanoarchaeota archaeon]|nr:hypothetical protein [Nanoarchaeota archaeon]